MTETFIDPDSLPQGELSLEPVAAQSQTAPEAQGLSEQGVMSDAEFEVFFRTHYPWLVGRMTPGLGSTRDRASDYAQETMIRFWKSTQDGKVIGTDGSPRPWLTAVASRYAIDELRARLRRPEETNDPVFDHEENDSASGFNAIENRMVIAGLLAAVLPEHRLILRLMYLEGLEMSEIAERFGTSTAAIKSRLHRAREAVKSSEAGIDFMQDGRLI